MKLYIHNKKTPEGYVAAMTLYSNKGNVLFCDTHRIRETELRKFDMGLLAIEWAIRTFRIKAQNGEFSETEKVNVYICSKTIYDWICKETSPKEYIDTFMRIQMEFSLCSNELEIIRVKNSKALYRTAKDKEESSISDLLKEFDVE